MSTGDWKQIAKAKKESVDKLIPKEWRLPDDIKSEYNETTPVSVIGLHNTFGILNDKEVEITEAYTANELLKHIADKKFTSLEVATAFCKRAAISTQLTNCCTELLFQEALARAKWLDEYLEENGKTVGPLHGLPISVKDAMNIKGFDSTIGYVSFIGNKKDIKEDAALVKILLELGAVIHVKTNIPTTMMSADSENNIFGRTLNPLNLTLTAGGSSGGEASLIKQRGSLVGIGTDIGGSVRIPSLCCGVYGFRTSNFRYPQEGKVLKSRNNYSSPVSAIVGPMAYDFENLNQMMDLVLNYPKAAKYDPDLIAIPWNNNLSLPKKIRVGVILECDSVPLNPPMERIIRDAVDKLSKSPLIEIVNLTDFPSFQYGWELLHGYFTSDPKSEIITNLTKSGEKMIKSLIFLVEANNSFKTPKAFEDFYELGEARYQVKRHWLKIINDMNLDIILCPGASHTAPKHDTFGNCPYTGMWNLVDFPSLIIPFGKVDKDIDLDDPSIKYCEGTLQTYDKDVHHGSPGHIQLVYRTLQDENVLKVGEIIDRVLNKS